MLFRFGSNSRNDLGEVLSLVVVITVCCCSHSCFFHSLFVGADATMLSVEIWSVKLEQLKLGVSEGSDVVFSLPVKQSYRAV